jgi:hypothetical protein
MTKCPEQGVEKKRVPSIFVAVDGSLDPSTQHASSVALAGVVAAASNPGDEDVDLHINGESI